MPAICNSINCSVKQNDITDGVILHLLVISFISYNKA